MWMSGWRQRTFFISRSRLILSPPPPPSPPGYRSGDQVIGSRDRSCILLRGGGGGGGGGAAPPAAAARRTLSVFPGRRRSAAWADWPGICLGVSFIVFYNGWAEHPETPRSTGKWRLSCVSSDVVVSMKTGRYDNDKEDFSSKYKFSSRYVLFQTPLYLLFNHICTVWMFLLII